jgi:hypothetical protein
MISALARRVFGPAQRILFVPPVTYTAIWPTEDITVLLSNLILVLWLGSQDLLRSIHDRMFMIIVISFISMHPAPRRSPLNY